jgi:lipoate synthase
MISSSSSQLALAPYYPGMHRLFRDEGDRYVHPGTLRMFEQAALAMGFSHIACGPLVRSSAYADEWGRKAMGCGGLPLLSKA